MALNATVGSPNANSYVTVEEADTYFADRVHSSMWDAFTDKEGVLITSSQMLDWYFKWKGSKATPDQSMGWPRIGAVRRDGTTIDDLTLPAELKTAVYEMALGSLLGDRTEDYSMFGLEQVKVSTLMVKANGNNPSTAKEAIPERVSKILSDLYNRGSMNVIRLTRA